ncbi:MAG: class I SAM-dependent methyltransferase [Promethearchaeota archaeon]
MNRIKSALRKWGSFYGLLQRTYYGFWRIIETSILGTKLPEWIWKTQHIFKGRRWIEEYLESVDHPRRRLLIEKIALNEPLESFLEIGCGMGANLYLLAKEFPTARLYGIDISSQAIREGKRWLERTNVKNVELFVGKADELGWLEDNSIDVVFTYATLMYIGIDKINKVIKEISRIARKLIFLYEWDFNDLSKGYQWYDGHWIYNYKSFLARYFSSNNIIVSRLPQDLWSDESWKRFGSIIEAKL